MYLDDDNTCILYLDGDPDHEELTKDESKLLTVGFSLNTGFLANFEFDNNLIYNDFLKLI